jgi:pyruvate-formate lyase-activating enzyme
LERFDHTTEKDEQLACNLLASDGNGNVLEIPGYDVLGRSGTWVGKLPEANLLPLPEGSEIFELTGRKPLGFNRRTGMIEEVGQYDGKDLIAVSAFLPPAYTVTHAAAYRRVEGAPCLPLFAYSPLGWNEAGYQTTAVRTDPDQRQESRLFDRPTVEKQADELLKKKGTNKLVRHLAGTCAVKYGCPAAMNYVLGRWEMPIPTSPGCNAHCVGCISYQPDGTFSSTQERIDFVPSVSDIVEAAVCHIETAQNPIVSFGQGCEGEPLLVSDIIGGAVKEIRKRTDKGTINLNTNASIPNEVGKLFEAGLTSMRVSTNSARSDFYQKYYRPRDYSFDEVRESVKVARKQGGFVSLNYLVFPGFTDQPSEVEAMERLVHSWEINMIQWRNLNIDPDLYLELIEPPDEKAIGIPTLLRRFQEEFPNVRHGYFNPYLGGREEVGDA